MANELQINASEGVNNGNSDEEFADTESEVVAAESKVVPENKVTTRSGRVSKRRNFEDYVTYNAISECANSIESLNNPTSVSEALNRSDSEKWQEAMQREYDSLKKNEV